MSSFIITTHNTIFDTPFIMQKPKILFPLPVMVPLLLTLNMFHTLF